MKYIDCTLLKISIPKIHDAFGGNYSRNQLGQYTTITDDSSIASFLEIMNFRGRANNSFHYVLDLS